MLFILPNKIFVIVTSIAFSNCAWLGFIIAVKHNDQGDMFCQVESIFIYISGFFPKWDPWIWSVALAAQCCNWDHWKPSVHVLGQLASDQNNGFNDLCNHHHCSGQRLPIRGNMLRCKSLQGGKCHGKMTPVRIRMSTCAIIINYKLSARCTTYNKVLKCGRNTSN